MIQNRNNQATLANARQRLVAASLVLVVLGASSAQAGAQNDGTGGSSQATSGNCTIVVSSVNPARIASDLEAVESESAALAVASPVAEVASPEVIDSATPAASPVASPATVEDTADPMAALRDELLATTESIFACLNQRMFDTYTKLTSDSYRGQLFGSDQPLADDLFIGLAASLPESDHRVVTIDAVAAVDGSRATAELTYLSAFQLHTAVWTFSRQPVDGLVTWVLESEQRLPVAAPQGTATVNVVFVENGYEVTPSAVIGSDVVLNLSNPTNEDHEALILRFEDGVGANDLLQNTSASLPAGVTLIGQSTVLAGDEGAMLLIGLDAGTYTIVDLLPDENGIPHLSSGMVATFRVLF